MGIPPEAVEAYLQNDKREQPIEVLESNWTTVQVFLRCELTLVGGGMGAFFSGVSAQEIRAVLLLMRIPRGEWQKVLDGVKQMAVAYADIRNKKAGG